MEITGIEPHAPAELSGVKVRDLIVAVNDKPIKGVDELQLTLSKWPAASPMKLTIVRGAEKCELYALPTDTYGP